MAKKIDEPPPGEITRESDHAARPREEGLSRRRMVRNLALGTTSALVFGGGLYAVSGRRGRGGSPAPSAAAIPSIATVQSASAIPPVNDARTPFEDVTTYNNFYEFGLSKSEPSERAGTLLTRPWTVTVDGEVEKPRTFDIDEILKLFPVEERVYRMRCVEAWSMVIPWLGLELGALLRAVNPTSRAKYVAFTTLHDPKQMPGQKDGVLDWPYVEGLRIDEAMHRLTLLAIGLYGKSMPNQNGAPIRLVVPWKYGFKGIKSIVRISLVEKEPPCTWAITAPREYGFFANVNPGVDHPRWSQASERRIGELGKRPTLMFNGYADEVAGLYTGMDLARFF